MPKIVSTQKRLAELKALAKEAKKERKPGDNKSVYRMSPKRIKGLKAMIDKDRALLREGDLKRLRKKAAKTGDYTDVVAAKRRSKTRDSVIRKGELARKKRRK